MSRLLTQKSPFLEESAGDRGSDTDDEVLYSKHSNLDETESSLTVPTT